MRVSCFSDFGCVSGGALMIMLYRRAKGYGRRIVSAIKSSEAKTPETHS